jgi:hypothetical protein
MKKNTYQKFDQDKTKKEKYQAKNKFMKSINFMYLLLSGTNVQHSIYCKSCKKPFYNVSLFEYIEQECINCRLNK